MSIKDGIINHDKFLEIMKEKKVNMVKLGWEKSPETDCVVCKKKTKN